MTARFLLNASLAVSYDISPPIKWLDWLMMTVGLVSSNTQLGQYRGARALDGD
jgi:hypothetical protein